MTGAMQAFFDQHATAWDTQLVVDDELIRSMLRLLPIQAGADVLDIGCGTGVMFPFILSLDPAKVDAVDLSKEMIAIAKKKATDARIRCTHADFLLWDKMEQYDFALIYNAYPHFMDKQLFAAKLHDVLRPGGRFVILHGAGRTKINGHHTGERVFKLSVPLRPCEEEALQYQQHFDVDFKIDTEKCYVLSGTKR